MVDRTVRYAGALLAFAVVALVLVGARAAPSTPDNYGPTDDTMRAIYRHVDAAKASGGLRLLALTAGLGLLALGHARLRPGPGRSLFVIGGVAAAGLFGLAALVRLAYTEPDFSLAARGVSIELFDGLARVADTAALLPAGLALAGFGAALPRHNRPSLMDAIRPSARLALGLGAAVFLCGSTLALSMREAGRRADESWVRAGGAFTVVGSLLVLVAVVLVGALLDGAVSPAAGTAEPQGAPSQT